MQIVLSTALDDWYGYCHSNTDAERERSLLMYCTCLLLLRFINTNIKTELSIHPSVCPSVHLSTHPSIYLGSYPLFFLSPSCCWFIRVLIFWLERRRHYCELGNSCSNLRLVFLVWNEESMASFSSICSQLCPLALSLRISLQTARVQLILRLLHVGCRKTQENVYLFKFMARRQTEVLEREGRSEFSAANANGFKAGSKAEADLGVASSGS